jgi:CBS domain-containing protein
VDEDGKLVGILSLNDLARFVRTPAGKKALISDVVAATVAAVCQPRASGSAVAA